MADQPPSRAASIGGLLVMLIGVSQFIVYGFVPIGSLTESLRQLVGLYLLAGIPLLLVVGVWLKRSTALPSDNHIHDILLIAFGFSFLIQVALATYGPIDPAAVGTLSVASVGLFVAGLIGLMSTIVLTYGGYCLFKQPGNRQGEGRWHAFYKVYTTGGLLVALTVLFVGIEVIRQLLIWSGVAGTLVFIVLAALWIVVITHVRLFALKAVSRLSTEDERERVFERFSPDTSPLTDLWQTYGFHLAEADDRQATMELDVGGRTVSRMHVDQIEADRPGLREFRITQDGKAASTLLLAFSAVEDGAEITVETVTERRLTPLEACIMVTRALYNTIYFHAHGFDEEDSWMRLSLHSIEHEF